jgi:hypothetical protein
VKPYTDRRPQKATPYDYVNSSVHSQANIDNNSYLDTEEDDGGKSTESVDGLEKLTFQQNIKDDDCYYMAYLPL